MYSLIVNGVHTLVFVQGSRAKVMGNIGVVTEATLLLIITQVRFCKYNYLHAKIASLAIVLL